MSQPYRSETLSYFCDAPAAAEEFRAGRILIVIDGEYPDNTVYLMAAAETATPSLLHFMMSTAGGLACLAVMEGDLRQVRLPAALQHDFVLGAALGNNSLLIRSDESGLDSNLQNAVVPLTVGRQGVLGRLGPAQCAVDIARLAGLNSAAFLCRVMRDKDEPVEIPSLLDWAKRYHIRTFHTVDMLKYRLTNETHVRRRSGVLPVKTRHGSFQFVEFESDVFDPCQVLIKGDQSDFRMNPPLLRIQPTHSPGTTCSALLMYLDAEFDEALELMYLDGRGILMCLPSAGRTSTHELFTVLTLPFFRNDPFATLEDSTFRRLMAAGISAQILKQLNADRVRVPCSKPRRLADLTKFGVNIIANTATAEETRATVPRHRTF